MSQEPGVSPQSLKCFLLPSTLARQLFFYITRCGHYFCDSRYHFSGESEEGRVPSRKTFLLFYIVSGRMQINYNGRNYTALGGQAVLMDCRQKQEYYAEGDLEFLWLHFDGANAAAYVDQIIKLYGMVFTVPDRAALSRKLSVLVKSCNSPLGHSPYAEMQRSQKLIAVLDGLLLPRPVSETPQPAAIDAAIHYIHFNLTGPLPLREIAQHAGLSVSHFSRLFRQATGMPPHEYIQSQRLRYAKELLMTTTSSIKEIAYAVGYSSETSFTTTFTDKVGVSPRLYRKLDSYLDL